MAARPKTATKPVKKAVDGTATAPATVKGPAAAAGRKAKPIAAPVSQPKAVNAATTPAASSGASENTNNVSETSVAAKSSNANAMKKKDLIDRVLAATGAKKKLVKDIVEATLAVLGDALSKGEGLNLPPFGKAKVSRQKENGSRNAMTVKVSRNTAGGQGSAKAKQTLEESDA